jgi:hypothetical protein
MADSSSRPFSVPWTIVSVVLFLAVELIIGTWLGPLIIGKYVSPMFHYQVQMLMHLLSFYLGGLAVGVLSPGVRITEPAAGAFVSVLVVFLMSFFMPTWYFQFDLTKVLVGGGIGFALALAGAWQGEKLMGNIDPDAPEAKQTARGRLRAGLWQRGVGLFVEKEDKVADKLPPGD